MAISALIIIVGLIIFITMKRVSRYYQKDEKLEDEDADEVSDNNGS
jgi:large-conductance mechanosensitive channel